MACSSPAPTLLALGPAKLSMPPPCGLSCRKPAASRRPLRARTRATPGDGSAGAASSVPAATTEEEAEDESKEKERKRCLRCGCLYLDADNSPTACAFHGYIIGEKGLFALSPPHQIVDGEWSDKSGVIVYRWNERGRRPNTGRDNWKGRWSCCQEREEDGPPCRRCWHVSSDDGFTLF